MKSNEKLFHFLNRDSILLAICDLNMIKLLNISQGLINASSGHPLK